jgi:arylsulfatase A-like enzyme
VRRRTFSRARAWLETHGDAPFFLLVHTYEPHTPYLRRTFVGDRDPAGLNETFGVLEAALAKLGQLELDDTRLDYVRALYDGGVAEADLHVGALLDDLERLGLAGTTLVVVTSDHGEDLGDRDPPAPGNHGHALFDEQALVPLVMRDPTLLPRGVRVAAQVRTVDVLPTILDRLGVAAPEGLSGRSLVPLVTGEEHADRPAFLRSVKLFTDPPTRLSGLRTGSRKLVVDETGRAPGEPPRIALYDLEADPGEREDVASRRPAERRSLLRDYRASRIAADASSSPEVDAERAGEQAERLRALGYIE